MGGAPASSAGQSPEEGGPLPGGGCGRKGGRAIKTAKTAKQEAATLLKTSATKITESKSWPTRLEQAQVCLACTRVSSIYEQIYVYMLLAN